MNKRLVFLVGVFVGQILMLPWLIKFIKSPRIEAIVIPDKVFNECFKTRTFIIHNVPWQKEVVRFTKVGYEVETITVKGSLKIIITTEKGVQKEFVERYGRTEDGILGFYDRKKHEIVSIDQIDILIHELRHVFEGKFHR